MLIRKQKYEIRMNQNEYHVYFINIVTIFAHLLKISNF